MLKYYYTRYCLFIIIYVLMNLIIFTLRRSDFYRIFGRKRSHSRTLKLSVPIEVGAKSHEFQSSVAIKVPISINLQNESITITDDFPTSTEDSWRTIKEICTENNLTTPLQRKNFLYSENNNFLLCWIRKIGSTSFTKLFADLKGLEITRNYYKAIDKLSPKNDQLLQDITKSDRVFKILAIRHPFERLVSAFRDRIEDNSKFTAQSWIYVPKIFHLTRPELFRTLNRESNYLQKIFFPDQRLKLIPTFEEFVRWIINQNSTLDDHWNQYYSHCSLCFVHYDYILRLDNYRTSDIDYIFSKLGIDKTDFSLPRLEQSITMTNVDTTCAYFKNLTREAIVDLYEKYRIDFEMFDYELDRYFDCTDGG